MATKKPAPPPVIQPTIARIDPLSAASPHHTLRLLPDPPRLLAADPACAALWDLATARRLRTFEQAHLTSLGGQLYGSARDGEGRPHLVRIDPETGAATLLAPAAILSALAVGRGGDTALFDARMAATRRSWTLRFMRLIEGQPHEQIVASATKPPQGIKLVDDGRGERACLLTTRDEVQVWSLETGALLHTLNGRGKHAGDAAFSHDGRWLVAVGGAKTACWELTTGAPRWFERHVDRLPDTTLCISADDKYVVSASIHHRRVTLRALTTGAALATFDAPCDHITLARFTPDDTLLLAGADAHLYAVTLPDGWR